MPGRPISTALLVSLLAAATAAQEPHSHHGETELLGTVHFPVSCAQDVRPEFTRAVALLHSFGYEESRNTFADVSRRDSACGMAYWGVAMTYYHPIWAPPTAADLTLGRAAAEMAAKVGAKTERERAYIDAIGLFYRDSDRVDHRTRALAYRTALEEMARRDPSDHEASIFFALMLIGTAPSTDSTLANQKRAAEILNGMLDKEPQHPGIAHYMIHAFDYPSLAPLAVPVARSYAQIAPSSPHALHMPSHIFTRLGLWQESIDSNLASAEAARRSVARNHPGAASFDALHALDYLEYAYLQIGDEGRAKQALDESAGARSFDEPNFAAGYALAAIPARFALERRMWSDAACLEVSQAKLPWENFRYATAITYFSRALGSARMGQTDSARKAIAQLVEVREGLVKNPIPGPYDWASQVESMRRAAASWLAYADGRNEEALELARAAADLDDKTGKHPVTPGSVLPPRELLGDLLREMGRNADALAEYESALRSAPNRFNSLFGAARAAELAGNEAKAHEYYGQLLANCARSVGSPEREEIRQARAFTKPSS